VKLAFVLAILAAGQSLASPCPQAPQPIRDIQANRYYIDAASSVVDPELRLRNDAAVKPLRDFRRALARQSDPCAVEWLVAWAEGDALLGRMSSNQAHYERKWTLAALGTEYLKLKPLEPQRRAIDPWLRRVADEVQRFAESRTKNNHYHWAGLAVGTVGAATASPAHWDFARRVFRDGCAEIRPDGTLPLELARKSLALHYHKFALEPLAKLAEIAAARGEDWRGAGGGCLERLEAFSSRT
jgi:poly(beta-D-mannuronate) lyase